MRWTIVPIPQQEQHGQASHSGTPWTRQCSDCICPNAQSLGRIHVEERMRTSSILNDVLGPVMRGPSSSHNAAAYAIACLVRQLLNRPLTSAKFTFDEGSSFAEVFRHHGSDMSFAAGTLGLPVTDAQFDKALELADANGVAITFAIERLPGADHPNTVDIEMTSQDGRRLSARAKSTGGGAFTITAVHGWPTNLLGDAYNVLVLGDREGASRARQILLQDGHLLGDIVWHEQGEQVLVQARRQYPLSADLGRQLETLPGVKGFWYASPSFLPKPGQPIFASAREMVQLAETRRASLGQLALAYEATLLGMRESDVVAEVVKRYQVMRAAVSQGLEGRGIHMQFLRPAAGNIFRQEAAGRLPVGGIHTRAAARALAVMHVNASHGLVVAAPTGGASGALPGAVVTLAEEKGLSEEEIALGLLAASAVGLIVDMRATFAAEVAGCQVEIGVAGAMAAAAVVEMAGGSASQAANAAAIALQNAMGSVCDLVQGAVEIPCHTRNASAAAAAFVCADLAMGGYANPIPLDETIDAMLSVGTMLPCELRCTGRGGLSQTPSALALPNLRVERGHSLDALQ